jgi:hypothetical protein
VLCEARHPGVRAGEDDAVAAARRLHAEGKREVRLAGPRRHQEDHVLVLDEEVELVEVQDGRALQAAGEGEVEVIERLHLREPGGSHRASPT